MYTVMISDDGMFSAEYVMPPALSIPLGTSGSAIDVVRNEDGTFSANGEVITAETMVTAENGNVYAAVLSPEGVPVDVMHVAAMQDVMLGALGGTVTLTQAEDKSWRLGEMAVMDGSVHTHENGNMYTLMLDAEGMWSAMYKKVEVMVGLGTQGSVTLERAEDMSWWLGSEAVDVGSEVMSESGNTYTLWYADGVWSTQFEPESMMIDGTGLVAMTRESDDDYDVADGLVGTSGDPLPSTGVGDVMEGDAMYHVWMEDGTLMGARFDAAIDTDTDHYVTNGLGIPFLSANDPDTPGNELRTHLVATGSKDHGRGMFSMGALLSSGMASDESMSFVNESVEEIEDVRAYVSAVLALDDPLENMEKVLDDQWADLNKALDKIFETKSDADEDATFAIKRQSAPREEDILDEIDGILAALSSESSFVAATAEDGDGVFESQKLGADEAAGAFNRVRWSADATLGMTGSTRYGTAFRKDYKYATDTNPAMEDYGAFSYSTMDQTVRTADAAAVSLTGIARYSGGTRAVSGKGKTYSGMMDLQVRFNVNSVSGVVTGLEDADGLPWQHNFADVSQIVLDDGTLLRNATWKDTGATGTVFYTRDSGVLRPFSRLTNTFEGILLGQGANAGSEANGVWSVGNPGNTAGYLTGGFGVVHVADAARPTPSGDDGSAAAAKLFTTAATNAAEAMTDVSIADGTLTVKQRRYGWVDPTPADDTREASYVALGAAGDETLLTAKFELATLAGANGAQQTFNGPNWVDGVVDILERERNLLLTLQDLDSLDTDDAEIASWQRVQNAVQYNLFGDLLPVKLNEDYGDVGSEAIDLIDRVLDALSSNDKLEAALDPDGTGIFDHYQTTGDDDNLSDTATDEDVGNFRYYDSGDRRNEVVSNTPFTALDGTGEATRRVNGRTIAQVRGEREYKVFSAMGTTDFTRFGFWRRESTSSARRNDGAPGGNLDRGDGGPGTYAYSPLDPTNVGTPMNPSFPERGSASYIGETVAVQNATILTGTVRVDVDWTDNADSNTEGTFDESVGMMALTISGLASAVGDPLSRNADNASAGAEIADIVFPAMSIIVGGAGDFADNMVVGTANTTDLDDVTYTEAPDTGVRYRRAAAGVDIVATSATATAKALFVGQGVDGPLGVIGTWTLDDDNVGRINGAGTGLDDFGVTIHGAFGAEVP